MAEAVVAKNVKAKAIHQIHHGDHDNHIKSGTVFAAPKDQVDRLVELGAAELVKDEPAPAAPAVK